jgi:CO dehydrogenase maturation factor
MGRTLTISVSGKGGVGKTVITALLLRALLKKCKGSLLAVDADPATNLPEVLGVKAEKTVGMVANELRRGIDKGNLAPGTSKRELLEARVFGALVECEGFDLLAMGRTEGEGCYCYVNSLLRQVLDALSANYGIVLMDMEAGLEHLSRRTDRDLDALLIITDASKMGLNTARRIKEVADEVHVKVGRAMLIGNIFPAEMEAELRRYASEIGVEFGGILPYDQTISKFNIEGRPLLELPDSSEAARRVEAVAAQIGLLN